MDDNELQILVKAMIAEAESLRTMQKQLIAMQEKLDKEDIRKLHREIGEAASDYIKEGFTTRGIKKRTSLF